MDDKVRKYAIEAIQTMLKRLTDLDYMEEQFGEEFPYFNQELRELEILVNGEIPGAKFEVGEYVYNCKNGKKLDDQIVEISSRSFTESRGWVYSISYKRINKESREITGGGSSCWWDEVGFEKIDDPLLLLIIKKHQLAKRKEKLDFELKQIERQNGNLDYAFQVIAGVKS